MEISVPSRIQTAICEKIFPGFCVYRSSSRLATPSRSPAASITAGRRMRFFMFGSPFLSAARRCVSAKRRFSSGVCEGTRYVVRKRSELHGGALLCTGVSDASALHRKAGIEGQVPRILSETDEERRNTSDGRKEDALSGAAYILNGLNGLAFRYGNSLALPKINRRQSSKAASPRQTCCT